MRRRRIGDTGFLSHQPGLSMHAILKGDFTREELRRIDHAHEVTAWKPFQSLAIDTFIRCMMSWLCYIQRRSCQDTAGVDNLKLRQQEDENIIRELEISENLIERIPSDTPMTGVRNNSGLFIRCLGSHLPGYLDHECFLVVVNQQVPHSGSVVLRGSSGMKRNSKIDIASLVSPTNSLWQLWHSTQNPLTVASVSKDPRPLVCHT